MLRGEGAGEPGAPAGEGALAAEAAPAGMGGGSAGACPPAPGTPAGGLGGPTLSGAPAPAAGPLGALRGRTLFGVAQDHPIEAQIGAYLAGRGIPVRLSYDYPGAMLALEAMEAGLGGCIMTASAARRLLERGGYCVVSFDGPDAPQWEVGVTYRKGSSKQAAIADLAQHLGA